MARFFQTFTVIDYTNEVEAPAAEAFALVERIGDWPRWFPRIKSARDREKGPWHVGHRIEFHGDFTPAPLPLRVFRYERNRVVGWGLGRPGSLLGSLEHRFDFEEIAPGRTRVRHREVAEGIFVLVARPFRKMAHDFNYDWAQALARVFERGGKSAA